MAAATVLAIAGLLLPAQGGAADATKHAGLVALLGEGATLDAEAGITVKRRLWIRAREAGAVDPLVQSGAPEWTLTVDPDVAHAGENPEAVRRAREAGCIVLSGGSAHDWSKLLVPGGWPSELGFAIREAHAGGVPVAAAGSAAPFLSQWAIVDRSLLQRPQRNPQRVREHATVEGLGLVRELLVDAGEGADPARLLRAGFDAKLARVLFLDGAVAWIADPVGDAARVGGGGAAILVDLSGARVQRRAWREGRLSVLSAGDSWTRRQGPLCTEAVQATRSEASDRVARLASIESLSRSLERVGAKLSLALDERTRLRSAEGGRAAGACAVSFDLEWPLGR